MSTTRERDPGTVTAMPVAIGVVTTGVDPDGDAPNRRAANSTTASRQATATRACLRDSVKEGISRACRERCQMSVTKLLQKCDKFSTGTDPRRGSRCAPVPTDVPLDRTHTPGVSTPLRDVLARFLDPLDPIDARAS